MITEISAALNGANADHALFLLRECSILRPNEDLDIPCWVVNRHQLEAKHLNPAHISGEHKA